jgi:hypothetical protein
MYILKHIPAKQQYCKLKKKKIVEKKVHVQSQTQHLNFAANPNLCLWNSEKTIWMTENTCKQAFSQQ